MGNTSKKLAAKCTLLTKEEQKHVAATFRAASKNSDKIREDDLIVSAQVDADSLERYWGPQIDPRLTQYLTKFLFGSSITSSQPASFNRFAELYVYNVRGTADEKLTLTYNCLGSQYNSSSDLPYQLLKEYCEAIVSTYIKILKASSSPQAKAWIGKGFRGKAAHVQALAEAAASGAGAQPDTPPTACDSRTLRQWLMTDTLFAHMTEMVYSALYGITREQHYDGSAEQVAAVPPLLPMVEGLGAMPDYPAFIDLAHIVWLNSHLPVKHQGKWRFLFSSHIHGESFATLAGRIQDQGASVLIIEDSNGYIFGGYATDSWQFNSTFYGGEESFLFTLAPRIRCYPATGFNNHYQYINNHTKTLPNGLLMGGQFDFGGIWINADPFGQGSSAESCSTYRGYKRLSKEQTFRIRSLEVWGVGEKPLTAKESLTSVSSRGSVLDSHKAEQKFLAMTGRHSVSEGLRC